MLEVDICEIEMNYWLYVIWDEIYEQEWIDVNR